MEKDIILGRLKDTIDHLKSLPEDQFDYGSYVSEFNSGSSCGTVCCVAGWYPKWFPEAVLEWYPTGERFFSIRPSNHEEDETPFDVESQVELALMQWHGLEESIISFLFYGSIESLDLKEEAYIPEEYESYIVDKETGSFEVKMPSSLWSDLEQVILGFEFIYYLIENDCLENYTYSSQSVG